MDNDRLHGGTPTVSVVVPLYNSSRYIEGALESVCRQTFANWECVLVDDGSTDDTSAKIQAYLHDGRFRYERQDNRGIAGARNTGIALARGAWICLLDHDDRWLPEKLERQVAVAEGERADVVFTDAVVPGKPTRLYSDLVGKSLYSRLRTPAADVFDVLLEANPVCASSVMVRKEVFDDYGLLDPRAAPADDYDLWLRCAPDSRFVYVPEPLAEYVVHGENYSLDSVLMHEKMTYVLEKQRKRFRDDPRRLAKIERALARRYRGLFVGLLKARDVSRVLAHAAALARDGRGGVRILVRSIPAAAAVARARRTAGQALRAREASR